MCQSETIILAETDRAVSYCLVPDTKKLRQKLSLRAKSCAFRQVSGIGTNYGLGHMKYVQLDYVRTILCAGVQRKTLKHSNDAVVKPDLLSRWPRTLIFKKV